MEVEEVKQYRAGGKLFASEQAAHEYLAQRSEREDIMTQNRNVLNSDPRSTIPVKVHSQNPYLDFIIKDYRGTFYCQVRHENAEYIQFRIEPITPDEFIANLPCFSSYTHYNDFDDIARLLIEMNDLAEKKRDWREIAVEIAGMSLHGND